MLLVIPLLAREREEGVVYIEELQDEPIKLEVVKPGLFYASKNGGRPRGSLKVNTVSLAP